MTSVPSARESDRWKARKRLVQSRTAFGEIEDVLEMLRERPFAAHAGDEVRVVELSAAQVANAVEDFFLPVGEMLAEPGFEHLLDRERQSHGDIPAGAAPASAAAERICAIS